MKPAVDMGHFELIDEFKWLAPCAIENGEYMERALELTGELLKRGLVGVPGRFIELLKHS